MLVPIFDWTHFSLTADALACAALVLLYRLARTGWRKDLPLPPGPTTSWFGRINLPKTSEHPWKSYKKWKDIYGDVIYIYVLGNPIIILNSREATRDLLDKRSAYYSSRPVRTMVIDLMGWDWIFSSMPYGERWRQHRRLFHRHFYPKAIQAYNETQIKEAHTLLRNLLSEPVEFNRHVRRTTAALVMKITYGHQVSPEGDYFVTLADKALETLGKAGIFGSYLVDYIPWLKHIPSWMPGAGFKRQAATWRKLNRAMLDEPFTIVKQQMAEGTAQPSIVAEDLELLSRGRNVFFTEDLVKDISAITYAAGAETTTSLILGFVLAMIMFPDVQRKAQEEIDRVIGPSRLPTIEDKDKLPYVNAVIFETMRWNPVIPLGLAHCNVKDDVYRGMRIPKNTTILANVWGIMHDEEYYPDPMSFRPERFIEPSPPGVNDYPIETFGFGRRICPGRYLAETTAFLNAACMLAAFNVSKAIDELGRIIEPDSEFTSGLLSRPKPFMAKFTPRSNAAVSLILETAELQH